MTAKDARLALLVALAGSTTELLAQIGRDLTPVGRVALTSTGYRFKLNNDDPSGPADIVIDMAVSPTPGKIGIVGDWDGDGTDDVGLYSPSTRLVELLTAKTSGPPDITYVFSADPFGGTCSLGVQPIAGDWDGNGIDTLGLYCPDYCDQVYLADAHSPFASFLVMSMNFDPSQPCQISWWPLAGDWDGDFMRKDTPGLYDRATGRFYLAHDTTVGSDFDTVVFQPPGYFNMRPLAGQWDRQFADSVGLFDVVSGTTFHIAPTDAETTPRSIQYGVPGNGGAVTGNWDGRLAAAPESNAWGISFDQNLGNSYVTNRPRGQKAFGKVHEMGEGWVRLFVYWSDIEPSPGQYDWTSTDAAVLDLQAAGLNVYANILWAPAWATPVSGQPSPHYEPFRCLICLDPAKYGCLCGAPGNCPATSDCAYGSPDPNCMPLGWDPTNCISGPPPDETAFRAFVREAVRRYSTASPVKGTGIKYWGFWNEPDQGIFWHSPETVEESLLIHGYDEAKSVDPNVLIVGPEVAAGGDVLLRRVMDEDINGSAGRFLDVLSFHAYGPLPPPNTEVQQCLFYTDAFGDIILNEFQDTRPVWVSESGIVSAGAWGNANTATPVTLARQRAFYVDLLQGIAARPWIDKIFTHSLYDGTATTQTLATLFDDASPRPAHWGMGNYILGRPPVAEFVGSPLVGDVPLQVDFTDLSLYAPEQYLWEFGDGATTSQVCDTAPGCASPVSHTYSVPGVYTVRLTATDPVGADAETKVAYVEACVPSPQPIFCVDPDGLGPRICDLPAVGTFDPVAGLSSAFMFLPGSPGTVTLWTFGDGGTSTAQSPTHRYGAAGTYDVTLTLTATTPGCAKTTTVQGAVIVGSEVPPSIITGNGPGAGNAARVFGFDAGSGPSLIDIRPYFANYGVNVGTADLGHCASAGASILTAPGPAPNLAPHIKAYDHHGGGTPITGVSFFAYGTAKYGARVTGVDVDGDSPPRCLPSNPARLAPAEIITGAGPGSVFGPHVRGFDYDGTGYARAMQKISYYAYGSLTYGVNVAGGSVNLDSVGTSGKDTEEILTGVGPGPTFGAHVRAWNFDANAISQIGKINFLAYPLPPVAHGVKVAGADLDGDGDDDLLTGAGPGPSNSDAIRSWEIAGGAVVTPEAQTRTLPAPNVLYGANVGGGHLLDTDSAETAYAARGPDPAADSTIAGYQGLGLTVPPVIDRLAYGPPLSLAHGALIAGSETPGFDPVLAYEPPAIPTDRLLRNTMDLVAALPDASFACLCCDAPLPGTWSVWGPSPEKAYILGRLGSLLDTLPSMTFQEIVDAIDDVSLRASGAGGIVEPSILTEVLGQLGHVRSFYAPVPAFPSAAVTASIEGFEAPDSIVFAEASGRLYARGVDGAGRLQELDVPRLARGEDRPLSGTVVWPHAMASPTGRPEVYAATSRDGAVFVPEPCLPPMPGRICGHFEFRQRMALERIVPDGGTQGDGGVLDVFTSPGPQLFVGPTAMHVTPPPGGSSLLADAAYVSSGAGLFAVTGVRDFGSAQVTPVPGPRPFYRALVPTPVAGSDVLFGLHGSGIDAIRTKVGNAISADVVGFPVGHPVATSMTSGVVAVNDLPTPVLLVAFEDRLDLYDAATYQVLDQVPMGGSVTHVHLSMDGRFILLTRYPVTSTDQTLVVLDAATRQTLRESFIGACTTPPCPFPEPANPMALTIDGSHAIVSDPVYDELDYVYLGPARSVLVAESLERVVASVPPEDYDKPSDQKKLGKDIDKIGKDLEKAETAPNEQARQAHLTKAMKDLEKATGTFDGCARQGSPDGNDVVMDCGEQATLAAVASDLADMISAQQEVTECPPMYP